MNQLIPSTWKRRIEAFRHRTVLRFGYALDGCVVEPPAREGAAIVFFLEWDKRLIPLPPGEHVIGRAADALVSVASDRVSRRHALIVVTGDTAAIQDLDSKNGTYVGAIRIDQTVDLKNGDRILVGPAMLIFRARPDDDSTASATRV